MLNATHETSSPCPDETVLAAYIDGHLIGTPRAQVEAHLAECEDCYEVLVETTLMESDAISAPRPYVGVLIVVLIGLVCWWAFLR